MDQEIDNIASGSRLTLLYMQQMADAAGAGGSSVCTHQTATCGITFIRIFNVAYK